MPDEEKKSRKSAVLERLKVKMPDADFEDEDALFGALDDEYAENETRYNELSERDKKMTDLFASNPRFAEFFVDVFNGGDVMSAFIEKFGKEALEASDDPDRMKTILEAENSYKERNKKGTEIANEQTKNLENSTPIIESFQKEKELSDDDMNKLINSICDDASAVFMGIFSKDVLEAKWKAEHFDASVEDAQQTGEVRGRNQQISELKKKTATPADIPPAISSKGASGYEKKEDFTSEFMSRVSKNK